MCSQQCQITFTPPSRPAPCLKGLTMRTTERGSHKGVLSFQASGKRSERGKEQSEVRASTFLAPSLQGYLEHLVPPSQPLTLHDCGQLNTTLFLRSRKGSSGGNNLSVELSQMVYLNLTFVNSVSINKLLKLSNCECVVGFLLGC